MRGVLGFLMAMAFTIIVITYMNSPVIGVFLSWAMIILVGVPAIFFIIVKMIFMFLNPFK